MALAKVGGQSTDVPLTPTLRQYAKGGGKLPDRSYVKTVFRPGKLPYYTFFTDHNFKVTVSEDNPLHGAITDNLDQWYEDKCCLVVVPDKDKIGAWELSVDTDSNSEWKSHDWGYSLSGYGKKRKTLTKTHP